MEYPLAESATDRLIRRLHDAPTQIVLALSGGGSRAIVDLLAVPGAARTVLEAMVPYSAAAMTGLLGARPERACSATTARAMAMAAFQRGLRYAPANARQLAGIGCTASLVSDRPKRGRHRVHVALQTARVTESWALVLDKGQRTRTEEERLSADLVLAAIARSAGFDAPVPVATRAGEQVVRQCHEAAEAWTDLLLGGRDRVRAGSATGAASPAVVFPGAFDPLHDGHRTMARLAGDLLEPAVTYELSILNVDKPPLDFIAVANRLRGLRGRTVWLTRAATFTAKARLFPRATFVVGVDTILRIADPRYYQNNPDQVIAAVGAIRDHGCRFLVFGRLVDGSFRTLADLPLPEQLRDMCREVPAEAFRDDHCSTEIRRHGDR